MFQQRNLDELNRAMLIAAIVFTIIGVFLFQNGTWPRYVTGGFATVLLVLVVLRLFNRNPARRNTENMRFLAAATSVRDWFKRVFRPRSGSARTHRAQKARKNPTWSEIRQYKYFICPQCAQRLRVPRGKGRIRVTCTHCRNVFETKS